MLNKIQPINSAPSFTSTVYYAQPEEDILFLANGTQKVTGEQALAQVDKLKANGHMNFVEIHHINRQKAFQEFIDLKIYDLKDDGSYKCRQASWNLTDAQGNFDLTELYKIALTQKAESPYCEINQSEGKYNPLMKKFLA